MSESESFSEEVDSQEAEADIRAFLEQAGQAERDIDVRPNFINNAARMTSKLIEFQLGGVEGKSPWIETLHITPVNKIVVAAKTGEKAREEAFYAHAVLAVQEAHKQFEQLGVPFRRPEDYFAEMAKNDDHMRKVKIKLENEKGAIERAEQRRRQKELKKFGKQVQVQKLQDRAHRKTEYIEAVKQWRKNRDQGGGGELDIENPEQSLPQRGGGKGLAKGKGAGRPGQGQGQGGKDGRDGKERFTKGPRSKKREYKDKKFGYGGTPLRLKKRNDEGAFPGAKGNFSVKRNKQLEPDLKKRLQQQRKGGQQRRGLKKRPGKARRQQRN